MASNQDKIEAGVQKELQLSGFAARDFKLLSGGNTNFIYRATLEKPLADGTLQVAIKHGEAYSATNRDFALTTQRCLIEEECLRFVAALPHYTSPAFSVGTPRLHYFNKETNTQVQDYLQDAVSLKDYSLKHFGSPTTASLEPLCRQLGTSLGRWLQSFHTWARQPENSELKTIVKQTETMQYLKHLVNYGQLLGKVDKYPDLLGDSKSLFQEVSDAMKKEVEDESKLQVIHGDFWTGNILIPDKPPSEGGQTPIRIVDWEVAQMGHPAADVGQCVAELWQLMHYKGIDAGAWMVKGVAEGYGQTDNSFAFRAILATGTHFVGFGESIDGWGDADQRREMAKLGKDLIERAWAKDKEWFRGHWLECLFQW